MIASSGRVRSDDVLEGNGCLLCCQSHLCFTKSSNNTLFYASQWSISILIYIRMKGLVPSIHPFIPISSSYSDHGICCTLFHSVCLSLSLSLSVCLSLGGLSVSLLKSLSLYNKVLSYFICLSVYLFYSLSVSLFISVSVCMSFSYYVYDSQYCPPHPPPPPGPLSVCLST